MSEAKHSPLPWKLSDRNEVIDANGKQVVVSGFAFDLIDGPVAKANTRVLLEISDAIDALRLYRVKSIASAELEIEQLRKQLNEEQNAHAELQARCFDQCGTGWSVFDEVTPLSVGWERSS